MTAPSASRQDHEVVRVELAVLLLPLLRAREARRISRGSRGAGRRQAQDVAAWRGGVSAKLCLAKNAVTCTCTKGQLQARSVNYAPPKSKLFARAVGHQLVGRSLSRS